MRKNNINLRVLYIMLLSIVMIKTNAQTGLNFQGVARTTNNVILASQAITIKLSILQGSATGTADYVETRRVTTNAQGLFTAVIGDTGAISTLGNFTTINWKLSPKFLKIEMDAAAGTNFITMGTTQFQYVAYSQFAKSVDAENIVGIVPVTLGGTGVNSLTGLKTALTLNNVNNTSDADKIISTKTQAALDLILVTATDTTRFSTRINTKADTTDLKSGLDLKLNAADTSKYTKQTYSDSALLTKLSTTGNASTATKLATSRSINGVAFDGSGDITVTADAGTLTGTSLKSTVTGSSLTSVGTLANLTVTNAIAGSITGNAATATTAGNITATTNTTLTSLSSLATVGTITSGVWSGTVVAVEKGGTGATTLIENSVLLGNGTSSIQAVEPGTSGNVLTSNGTTWTSAAAPTYTTGANASLGGYIFFVTPDQKHGLVAATQDQSNGIGWYDAQDVISKSINHNIDGAKFTDWRLPTSYEISLMYAAKLSIGGFADNYYWSSTEFSYNSARVMVFSDGTPNYITKSLLIYVRAIRAF